MSFLNNLKSKYSVKEKVVKSKAKTVDELIEQSFTDQKRMINGEKISSTGGKFKKSWRSDNGDVSIKIGVLPLFVDGKDPVTFSGVSEGDYKSMVDEIWSAYQSGNLSAEVEDLKKRKAASDKANAESRRLSAEKDKMKKEM
jgi:hypothetical protein